jgi:hypothetical protein
LVSWYEMLGAEDRFRFQPRQLRRFPAVDRGERAVVLEGEAGVDTMIRIPEIELAGGPGEADRAEWARMVDERRRNCRLRSAIDLDQQVTCCYA